MVLYAGAEVLYAGAGLLDCWNDVSVGTHKATNLLSCNDCKFWCCSNRLQTRDEQSERFTAAPMPPSAQRSAEKTMVALVIALLFYLAATAFPVPI